MSINLLIRQCTTLSTRVGRNVSKCSYATKGGVIADLEVEETPVFDVQSKYTEEELMRIRNKSRLQEIQRNVLFDTISFKSREQPYYNTLLYRRKMLGRYGMEKAGITPAIAWPTEEEIEDKLERERVQYPDSLQEVWKQIEEKKVEEALAIKEREEEIDKVIVNLDKWRKAIEEKMAKKEAQVLEAKKRKERIMIEIRDKLGYKIDPHDERVQELLDAKSKDDKRKKRELKKKMRSERLLRSIQYMEEKLDQKMASENVSENEKSELQEKESSDTVDSKNTQ